MVVIAVTLEGSARRLVTVRSALQVTNNLEETVELRLEPPPFSLQPSKTVRVPPCTTYPIPMSYLLAQVHTLLLNYQKMNSFYSPLLFLIYLDFCSPDGRENASYFQLLQRSY